MTNHNLHIPVMQEEFSDVDFGHRRLSKRCEIIVNGIKDQPAATFPDAMGNQNDTQSFYRFCRNPRAHMRSINTPHFKETARRVDEADGEVIVCHDTTAFTPASASPEDGFYEITTNTYGLYLHVALASCAKTGLPLGVLGGRVVDPAPAQHYVNDDGVEKERSSKSIWKDPKKQSRRWFETVWEIQQRLVNDDHVLNLFDSEADSYEAFAELCCSGARFIARLKHNRTIPATAEAAGESLFEFVDDAPVMVEREIVLSRRTKSSAPKRNKTHPSREKRRAKLEIRAKKVEISRHRGIPSASKLPETLELNIVSVREKDCPEGCEPISWNLLTTEPITSAKEIAAVVDNYCKRWRVEEYFDVLKNGCALNERLPESRQTAEVVIALLLPLAWQLLWLRQLERLKSTAPASLVFPKERVRILRALLPKNTLPPRPSVRHIVKAIATYGGHLPQNGPPGWRILWRGYQKFVDFEQGWLAARAD